MPIEEEGEMATRKIPRSLTRYKGRVKRGEKKKGGQLAAQRAEGERGRHF